MDGWMDGWMDAIKRWKGDASETFEIRGGRCVGVAGGIEGDREAYELSRTL